MNLFEAAIIPAIPLGAIAGGILCKSHGVLATIGGVFVGSIAGGFAGWLFGFLMIFLISVIGVLWSAAQGQRDPPPPTPEAMDKVNPAAARAIFITIICAGLIALKAGWPAGLLVLAIAALLTATLAAAKAR